MAFAISAALDAPRLAAKLTVTGIPPGYDELTIDRLDPRGDREQVRGVAPADVTGTTYIVRDYELPFNVEMHYVAHVTDGSSTQHAEVFFQIDYDDCDVWFVDIAKPTNSLAVTVESLKELQFQLPAGIHRVLDRPDPVMTMLPAWLPSGEGVVLTDTLAHRDRMRKVLGAGYPMAVRSVAEQGIGDHYGVAYFGVTEFVEERILALGTAPERRFRMSIVRVERPDPSTFAPQPPVIYSVVRATYASYGLLQTAVGSYDELAYTYPP